MFRRLSIILLTGLYFFHIPSSAHEKSSITNVRFFSCANVDLTDVGKHDWVVFGEGIEPQYIRDEKKEGRGIHRSIRIKNQIEDITKQPITRLTYFWSDGQMHTQGEHGTREDHSLDGISIEVAPQGQIRFAFEGGPHDVHYMASIIVHRDTPFEVIAKQAGQSRPIHQGKGNGIVQVEYTGASTLYIDFIPTSKSNGRLSGIAATLSEPGRWWVRDGRYASFYKPTPQSDLLTQITTQPNYLDIAQRFADCMIQYGRDTYGKTHSPLFANLLTREQTPVISPYPRFAKQPPNAKQRLAIKNKEKAKVIGFASPFYHFNFNNLLNYPKGLSNAGPHKMTFYGSDPYEDRELYQTLIELSRITGNPTYKHEAENAIQWWFQNTQGPSGLYPWGEHLGWDFEHETPTYFSGPSKHLYHAQYHEVKDFVPFLNNLIILSANKPSPTPLEHYALGIWNMHFWDKEKAYYNRHADYTGQEKQTGEVGAFPAHLAFYLRIWIASYIHSTNSEYKDQITHILNRVIDMAISRTEKYGIYPFDLSVDLEGTDPNRKSPNQSIRLAHHAIDLAHQLDGELPEIQKKLRKFSILHLGDQSEETTMRNIAWAQELKSSDFIQNKKKPLDKPDPADIRDLSDQVQSTIHATEILYHLKLYHTYNEPAYLKTAETYARLAYAMFCDDTSPLPKGFAKGVPLQTAQGNSFPDFYFQGAKLMKAFALLGEALQKQ